CAKRTRLGRDPAWRRPPTRNPRPKRLGRLLCLFHTSYIFEPPQHFRRGAIHMLEHMFSHKRRCLLSGANKATSTTQDANRRVNGKLSPAQANVRLVGQSQRRVPAPSVHEGYRERRQADALAARARGAASCVSPDAVSSLGALTGLISTAMRPPWARIRAEVRAAWRSPLVD